MQSTTASLPGPLNSNLGRIFLGLGLLLGQIAFILVIVSQNKNPSPQILVTQSASQTLPNNFTNSTAMIITNGPLPGTAFTFALPANFKSGNYINLYIEPGQSTVTFSLNATSGLTFGDTYSSGTYTFTENTTMAYFQIVCMNDFVWVQNSTRKNPT